MRRPYFERMQRDLTLAKLQWDMREHDRSAVLLRGLVEEIEKAMETRDHIEQVKAARG